jgi:hypothetical protein
MDPRDATSPIDRSRHHNVIYISPNGEWSICEMQWRETKRDAWFDTFGIRYNGDLNNPSSLGVPNAHAKGMWFRLPNEMLPLVRAFVEMQETPSDRGIAGGVGHFYGAAMNADDQLDRLTR